MARQKHGFSLIELLIVVAIIGVLVAMLLPAVQKVRESANSSLCRNNFHQIGQALHAYNDVYLVLPAAWINPGFHMPFGSPSYYSEPSYQIYNQTGFLLLLPFVEQDNLHRQFDFRTAACDAVEVLPSGEHGAVDLAGGGVSANNAQVVSTRLQMLLCPSDPNPSQHVTIVSTNPNDNPSGVTTAYPASYGFSTCIPVRGYVYGKEPSQLVGHRGMFGINGAARLMDIHDGASNTIAMGEKRQLAAVPLSEDPRGLAPACFWGAGSLAAVIGSMNSVNTAINRPAGMLDHGYPASHPAAYLQNRRGFGSWHTNGAHFLYGDGSVRFLTNATSVDALTALGTIHGNETVDDQ